jgi:hypothetical protein
VIPTIDEVGDVDARAVADGSLRSKKVLLARDAQPLLSENKEPRA